MAGNGDTSKIQDYWDKYGIPRCTLAEGLWQVEFRVKHNLRRGCVILISEAGEGKSQGISAIARKYGRRLVDIRTAQFSLIGAGVPQRGENGFFPIAVPDDFPKEGEKTLMVFDELNQGQSHAIAMFFKLLEDRSLYNYKLPDDCIIVGMMNPATAMYSVSKIEGNAAINRRVKKFYVYNTFGDWERHAQTESFHYSDGLNKPCHPLVLKFLRSKHSMLYTSKERDASQQYACPATWQTVSLDLYALEAESIPLYGDVTQRCVASTIGNVTTDLLMSYIRNNEILISPEEVLQKYTKTSSIRKRVVELLKPENLVDKGSGDIPDLCESVAQHLFSAKYPADEVGPKLALFWSDLPPELAQQLYGLVQAACKTEGGAKDNIRYMLALTKAMNNLPEWLELNNRLNQNYEEYERKLKGMPSTKDPLS